MRLPKITNKQKEILKLLYQFRFLNRTHIQDFLKHKDKQQINRWLKDLTEKGYIGRIYDSTIVGTNRIPAIYYLAKNGIKFLKAQNINPTIFHKLYFEKNRSQTFIDHALLIASVCCQLEKKNSEVLHYKYVTQSDYSNPSSEFNFLKETFEIDLCFSKKFKGKKQCFLLTLFDETLPKYRIRRRIRDYIDFYLSNVWENNMKISFPKILLVFQTKERMIYSKRYVKIILEEKEPNLSINFATSVGVQMLGITGEVWE